jgi:hypothetical protein
VITDVLSVSCYKLTTIAELVDLCLLVMLSLFDDLEFY